jgi:hypothetical protein
MDTNDLADDLLDGVGEISKFTGFPRRRVYYLAERGLLPLFKIGDRKWQGRKSTLRQHIANLESDRSERVRIATTASA